MSHEAVTFISMSTNKLIAQCYEPLIDGFAVGDDGKELDISSSPSFQSEKEKCKEKFN